MVKAVILAGGKGLRLRPLTYEMAKVMIPLKGKPLLDHVIDLYFTHSVFEIWLILGYRGQDVIDKFPYPYFLEKHPTGTGGWLQRIDKKYFGDTFFVNNGDNLFDIDLKAMAKFHVENKNVVTIACTHVKDIRPFGSVHIKDGKIIAFEEKKKLREKQSGYINSGYYIFSPEIFKYIPELKENSIEPLSLEYEVFPKIAKDGKLGAFVSDAQWFSLNDFKEYKKAIEQWKGITP